MGWRDYMDDGSQFKPYAVPKTQPNETGWRAYMPKPVTPPNNWRDSHEYAPTQQPFAQPVNNSNATFLGGLGQDLQNTLGYKLAQFGVDKSAQGNWLNDKVVGTVNAGAGIAKTLADLVSPGGTISRNIDGFIQGGKDIMTPERQAADASYNLQLAQAKANGGTGIGVMAQHYKQNPSVLVEDGVGNALPFLLSGGTLGAATLGAASGAGTVRGGIYDNTQALDDAYLQNNNADYRGLRSTLSEAQAKDKIGSAFLPNAPMIAGGAATGLLTGATGIGRMLSGKGGSPIRATLAEIGGQALDEASQQLLSNAGTKFNVNPNHRLSDDLALNAFGGALIGAPGGVIAGAGTHANNKKIATDKGNLGGMFTNPPSRPQTPPMQAPQINKSAPLVNAIRNAGGVGTPRSMSGLDALGYLISRGEGNYNSFNSGTKGVSGGVIGHSGQRNLSAMSVSDILNTDGLSGNDKNRVFAAGKYQITIPTLRGAVKALGLNGSEKFTPQLQERIFKEYLIHKAGGGAVTRYLNGTGSLRDAQIGLAQEWRSFADPRTGRTYSDSGAKANKASISADESARILTAIKNGGDLSSFMAGNQSIDSQPFDTKTTQFDSDSALQDYQDELQSQLEEMQAAQEQAYADQQDEFDTRVSELQDKFDALQGADTEVEVNGKYEPSQWMIQEADSLGATIDKADNQLRDRNRLASEVQINEMANNLDHRKLMDSPMMDHGAPTLANDGATVIGGNGRVAAIKRAYEQGKANTYRENIKANAGRFGFTPEQVAQYKKPVLTRRFKNFVDVQQAAIASNEGGGLTMSALEQSKVDASRLPPLSAFTTNETGELNTAANRDAIRAFVGAFPINQQSALIGSDGQLSQQGLSRLKNAMLYQAYGDSPTLSRLVESNDIESRNVGNAMMQAAGTVADAKSDMVQGDLHDLDISQDIMRAADILEQIKAEGGTIREYLAQRNLFDEHMTPVSRRVLRFLDKNIRSAKKIRDLINAYYDAVRAVGSPKQADMLGGDVIPTREQLMEKVINDAESGQTDEPNLFEPEPNREATAGHERSTGAIVDESGKKSEAGRGDGASAEQSGEQGLSDGGGLQFSKSSQTNNNFDATARKYGGREAYEQAKSQGQTELNYHQWVQVRTPEFKAWFGDWENDPDNASKVINPKTGEPLVMYHGTRADFNTFDLSAPIANGRGEGEGFYFISDEAIAKKYAKRNGSVIAAFLNMRKPFRGFDGLNADEKQTYLATRSDEEAYKKLGIDGFIVGGQYIVRHPNQIKSATDNIGAFSVQNDDIRFSRSASNQGYLDKTAAQYGGHSAYEQAKSKGETELNYRQWVQVRTPEFKAWFGDWENDPENASKVVNDKTGEPLVVYHGTEADFNIFSHDFMGSNGTVDGQGFYFTDDADFAGIYQQGKGRLIQGFLNIRNPLSAEKQTLTRANIKAILKKLDKDGSGFLSNYGDVEYEGYNAVLQEAADSVLGDSDNDVELIGSLINAGENIDAVYRALETAKGTSGMIVPKADGSNHYVVGRSNQIKSATDNIGAFSVQNDDIRFSHSADTKAKYEQRIDELFAGDKPRFKGIRVLDQGRTRILTEKNLAGYRKSQNQQDEGKNATQKTSVRAVQKAIHDLLMFKDNESVEQQLPNVRVVQSDPSVGSDVQAMYNHKTKHITLIADNIPAGQERGVFLHEVFHKRGRELMGERYAKLKGLIEQWANHSEGSIERQVYDAAKRRADESGETGQRYDDELIAYSIEEAVNRGIEPKRGDLERTGVRGFVARAMQLFNQVLSKVVGKPISLTPRDLVTAAHAAAKLEAKNTGKAISTMESEPQLSKRAKGFENVPDDSIKHEEKVYKSGKFFNQTGELKLGKAAYDKLTDVAKSNYSPLSWLKFVSNKPAVFTSIMHDYRAENTRFQRAAQDIANESKSFDAIERKVIKELLTNELEFDTVPTEHIVRVVKEIRTLLNNQTDELVANGMLSRESAERWRENYLPRFYDKQADLFGGVKQGLSFIKSARAAMRMGMDGSHLKGRGIFKSVPKGSEAQYEAQGWEVRGQDAKGNPVVWRDYTKAERANMNENQDGIMSFTAGYMQTQADLAKARLFKRISENEELASKTYRQDWVQIPDIPIADTGIRKFGSLGGMFVHPEVYDHMKNEFGFANQGALLKTWRKALGYWKSTKTVYNPVAHMNNMVSNVSMLWLAGGNPQDLVIGCRDLIKKQGYYEEAIDAGLIGDGVDSAAIRDMFGGVQNVKEHGAVMNFLAEKSANWHVLKPLVALKEAAEKAYRTEDEVFKFSLYTQQRNKGMSIENAREYANQFFFDYADMPQGLRVLRDTAVLPFISYTSKAIPAIMRATLTRPHRMLAWVGAAHAINALSYMVLGSAGDEEEEKKNMPEYRQGAGLWGMPRQIRLPWNDDGKAAFLDITRMIPLGDFTDTTNQQGGLPLPNWMMPNGPVLGAFSVLALNKDPFTGDEFKKSYETFDDTKGRYAKWLLSQWLPSSVGVPFSYHTNNVLDGVKSQFENTWASDALEAIGYTGRKRSGDVVKLDDALRGSIGIKTWSFDPKQQAAKDIRRKQFEAREIKSDMSRTRKDNSLTSEQKADKLNSQRQALERLFATE